MTGGGDKQCVKYIQFVFWLHALGSFPRLLSNGLNLELGKALIYYSKSLVTVDNDLQANASKNFLLLLSRGILLSMLQCNLDTVQTKAKEVQDTSMRMPHEFDVYIGFL